jgi:3-hydroxyisobutyrate dehydrogenase-like beta-hydroxyacid dehydrogenase
MDDRTLPRTAVLGTGLMGRPMAGRLLAAGFPARLLLKDLRLVVDQAHRVGLFAPFLEGLVEIVERTVDAGFGEADYSALAVAVEPMEAPN